MSDHTLIVITGPTGSGKTDLAIKVAKNLGCSIISADSRQIYKDIPIGTAAPTEAQLAEVPHFFVGTLPLDSYYSAARFESEVLELLPRLWSMSPYTVMCGGSMMYVDAVCRGIDDLPDISPEIRTYAHNLYETEGLEAIQAELMRLDPEYCKSVDPKNHKRIVHAIEISLQSGVPYSSLRTGQSKQRPFRIIKFALDWHRDILFERINRRVDAMIAEGFEEEARRMYPLRHLNSLNTVGFKEMFAWFDGIIDRNTAIARMAKNTRVYAKKQLTWLKRDPEVIWLDPASALPIILSYIQQQ